MKINFSNTEVAFQLKSNAQLQKARLMFLSISRPSIVKFLQWAIKLCFKLHLPIKWIIKGTVFEHFCGGETIEECTTQVAAMYSKGVYSILDYSVEGKHDEADFERTKTMTMRTIEYAASNPGVPFSVFKPSGIGRHDLYVKVGKGEKLNPAETAEWNKVRARYYEMAQLAFDKNIPLMVDAEEVSIQQAIDDLVAELMEKFNKEKAIVWNTAQLYRWDRLQHLKDAVAAARQKGYFYGVKIVRGAYMERERRYAKAGKYTDPIQPNKAATDQGFNDAVTFLVENIDIASSMIATHNEASSQLVSNIMTNHNIDRKDKRIYVAQLFGMSDNLTFNMADAGHHVVKYLPFGPVQDVLPYLFRRAEENTSIAGQTSRELSLINAELKRRRHQK